MPITLPIHEWFTADFDFQTGLGNRYSGSVGTDGSTGSLGRTLFEYNAVMCRTEEQDADGGKRKTVTLHVACGIRRPWPDGAVWTDAQKADFPGTPAGLEQAAAWLEERLAESDVGEGRIGV